LPVILVNKVVDPKRIIGKKWRAKEEERHKGLLTPQKGLLISTPKYGNSFHKNILPTYNWGIIFLSSALQNA
jgi:hypothetical protein